MPINRKPCCLGLILAASLLIPNLELLARGRGGYSRGSVSRYSGSGSYNRSGNYNRGSMSSYSRGASSSSYNRGS